MKPENQAWDQLFARAAALLHPDFADRVLRAARAGVGAAPSLLSQFALGAATAAICFLAVAVFKVQSAHEEDNRAIADWQQIASAADDSGFMQ
jgi:hypothetical protein